MLIIAQLLLSGGTTQPIPSDAQTMKLEVAAPSRATCRTTVRVLYRGCIRIGAILLRLYKDNGEEHGSYYLGFRVLYRGCIRIGAILLRLYKDNGKEHGSYYLGFRVLYRGCIRIEVTLGLYWL